MRATVVTGGGRAASGGHRAPRPTVARTTSSHGVAVSPKVAVVAASRRRRTPGPTGAGRPRPPASSGRRAPTARSTGHGMPLTRGAGAPIAAARSVSACRCDARRGRSARARPGPAPARRCRGWPAWRRRRAGRPSCAATSGSPTTQARRPAPQRRQLPDQVRLAGRDLRADEVRGARLGDPHPAGLVRGQRVGPHPVAHPALGVGGGERRLRRHRPGRPPVAVEVAHRDQDGAGALGRGEQRRGDGRPVGRPSGGRPG